MAPKRPCLACGQIGHPLKECAFRGFYEPGQDKPFMDTIRTPLSSYAQICLKSRVKRQVVHRLRSHELRKPKSSPLALYCETLAPSDDAVETTPATESMPSDDAVETTPATELMPSEDAVETTPATESTTSASDTEKSKSN
ncbi:Zinc finger, CCHC-type [Penicillium italicum]|uniref:Zinc finger, CCHC-type n=1 Tax=Penicillium italicum TaxID=40296 RepID=A0A0A2KWN8_PENIT|nr:Zinc finger, CCHC-type [Penicillium italicum]